MQRLDNEKFALEAATGGRNTLLFDDMGRPSVMVRIPRFKWNDVLDGGEDATCSAFIVDGQELDEIYISKYQNIVEEGRAYSIAGRDPATSTNFDQAKQYCEAKGPGWHLMTNVEWAAIALWCHKNATIPRGNNNYGRDHTAIHEHGIRASGTQESINRVLTGSGPASWAHDWTPAGIYDLNGNVWEWVGGLRLKEGEYQVIPDNNAAMHVDQSPTSPLWKAINTSGAYVAPGSANTYKLDCDTAGNANQTDARVGAPILNTVVSKPNYTGPSTDAYYGRMDRQFQTLVAQSGVTAHVILKELGLFPADADLQGDYLYARNYGERLPLRGGYWIASASAGVFALHLNHARSNASGYLGFRSAFVNL